MGNSARPITWRANFGVQSLKEKSMECDPGIATFCDSLLLTTAKEKNEMFPLHLVWSESSDSNKSFDFICILFFWDFCCHHTYTQCRSNHFNCNQTADWCWIRTSDFTDIFNILSIFFTSKTSTFFIQLFLSTISAQSKYGMVRIRKTSPQFRLHCRKEHTRFLHRHWISALVTKHVLKICPVWT